jgi:hypothetical protein
VERREVRPHEGFDRDWEWDGRKAMMHRMYRRWMESNGREILE